MSTEGPRIKVTSRSFSQHPILRKELIELFPNTVFRPDGFDTTSPNWVEFLKDANGIILGLENLDRSILRVLDSLKVVAKYGVGLDNLDVDAARDLGISVGWTGGINKRSVSEQALAFMIGLSRNIFDSSLRLKAGEWHKEGGAQLTGKCVGIIGCGHIGEDLIHMLQPFRCKILINDIVEKNHLTDTYDVIQVTKEALIQAADFISLHVPLTDLTNQLVNESFLSQMKASAFLINTSRGPIVEQEALKAALQDQKIAGAALDVFELEPPDDLELLGLPNLIPTPHIGGNAEEAVLAMGRSAIDHLRKFFGTSNT